MPHELIVRASIWLSPTGQQIDVTATRDQIMAGLTGPNVPSHHTWIEFTRIGMPHLGEPERVQMAVRSDTIIRVEGRRPKAAHDA